jgi:hypothetical protein
MYIIKSYGINHDGVSQNKHMIKWIQTRLLTLSIHMTILLKEGKLCQFRDSNMITGWIWG